MPSIERKVEDAATGDIVPMDIQTDKHGCYVGLGEKKDGIFPACVIIDVSDGKVMIYKEVESGDPIQIGSIPLK